jgi:hypothetical protein
MDAWADYAESMGRLSRTVAWTEIAFPDLRLETPAAIGTETSAVSIDGLVISFPVHVVGFTTRGKGAVAGASFFLEPAFPTHRAAARGFSGVRAFGLHAFGAVLEGGGIVATDGSGAFAGGGPAIGDATGMIALVGRRYFVEGADRWDFTLELTMPGGTLVGLIGG